jgi:sialic acid synthase SpsE
MQTTGYTIGPRAADRRYDPYIIAEIGVNHGGDLKLAMRLIDEAKRGGAHAAKFQSYKADKIASKHSPAYWDTSQEPTRSQHELFQKYDQFGPAEYCALAEHCRRVGIEFMSTPFDLDAVDDLAPLMPAFKIASADITNLPLIRKCAATGKPLIISTGAADLPEVAHAVAQARAAGATRIALLHCVLNYPTAARNAQLGMITVLQRAFPECPVGYSDHVVPDDSVSALEAATLLGATILEKHFTHDKSLPGNDHYHAMNSEDLRRFVAKIERYRLLVGEGRKDLSLERDARLHARRSVVAARVIRAGQLIAEADLIAKRPGHGISPLHWDEIVGRKATRDIAEDALLEWDMLSRSGVG